MLRIYLDSYLTILSKKFIIVGQKITNGLNKSRLTLRHL
jgi:hypothetical protein